MIDWSRIAEPQPDQYDSRVVLHLAATRPSPGRVELYARRPAGDCPTIFDGAVAVRYCYPKPAAVTRFANARRRHPNIDRGVDFVRHWPEAFAQFQRLMDSFHPWKCRGQRLVADRLLGHYSSYANEAMFGTMAATIDSPLRLAERFVRELARQKLYALGVSEREACRLVKNSPDELHDDRQARTVRRVTALLHRAYEQTYRADLYRAILTAVPDRKIRAWLALRLRTTVEELARHLSALRHRLELDGDGRAFAAGFYDWAERAVASAETSLKSDLARDPSGAAA